MTSASLVNNLLAAYQVTSFQLKSLTSSLFDAEKLARDAAELAGDAAELARDAEGRTGDAEGWTGDAEG